MVPREQQIFEAGIKYAEAKEQLIRSIDNLTSAAYCEDVRIDRLIPLVQSIEEDYQSIKRMLRSVQHEFELEKSHERMDISAKLSELEILYKRVQGVKQELEQAKKEGKTLLTRMDKELYRKKRAKPISTIVEL